MFPWLWPPGFSDILSQQLLLSLPIPHTQMQQNKQNLYIPFPSMLPYNCCLQNSWSSGIVGDRRAHLYSSAIPVPLPTGMQGTGQHREGNTTGAETPLLCSTLFAAPFTPVQLTSSIKLSAAMTVLYLKQIWEYWARQWYPSLKVYPEPGSALNEGEIISGTLEAGRCCAQNIFWPFLWKTWSSHHFPIQLNST